ncbi:ComZ family protein [Pseudalkalibacillus caeni]|uniref:Competence protein ComG n=1 Tax=Exobacillus caeni TaxID=2574798 RepID=A0A5R9F864_9BACL|nr:ComZ family protein [Pseudalkalibacillus caeni]TLS37818.1 competence protein ComG [Pseudalkalibacillus caeni]
MNPENNMKFMQIAMQYLPQAKEILGENDVEVDLEKLQPLLELFMNAMNDAYELGREEAGGE